jgi:hypothetical protein
MLMAQESDSRDVTTVALASLVKMVGLLCAELTVGSHHDNFDLIENCVRAKLHASVDGVSPEATAAGVALAHRLVGPVLRELRARAQNLDGVQSTAAEGQRSIERMQ